MAKQVCIKLSTADVRSATPADVAAIIAGNFRRPPALVPTPTHSPQSLLDDQVGFVVRAHQVLPASFRESIEAFLPTTPSMDYMLSSRAVDGDSNTLSRSKFPHPLIRLDCTVRETRW